MWCPDTPNAIYNSTGAQVRCSGWRKLATIERSRWNCRRRCFVDELSRGTDEAASVSVSFEFESESLHINCRPITLPLVPVKVKLGVEEDADADAWPLLLLLLLARLL